MSWLMRDCTRVSSASQSVVSSTRIGMPVAGSMLGRVGIAGVVEVIVLVRPSARVVSVVSWVISLVAVFGLDGDLFFWGDLILGDGLVLWDGLDPGGVFTGAIVGNVVVAERLCVKGVKVQCE